MRFAHLDPVWTRRLRWVKAVGRIVRRAGGEIVRVASAAARAVARGWDSVSRLVRRTAPQPRRGGCERAVVDVHDRVVRRIHTVGLTLHNALDGLPSNHPVTGLLTSALGELDDAVKEVQDAVLRRFRPRHAPAVPS